MVSDEDGVMLVRQARSVVASLLVGRSGDVEDESFNDRFSFRAGVFVTLNKNRELRGCIGYPDATRRLSDALRDAAVAAASEDPRFRPVRPEELDEITFEVTVLSDPEPVRVGHPEEYPHRIRVGRDGLIVSRGSLSGLLLPQVPVEYGWDEAEFLGHACHKAGLEADCWRKDPDVEILRFGGASFGEASPNGEVTRRHAW